MNLVCILNCNYIFGYIDKESILEDEFDSKRFMYCQK